MKSLNFSHQPDNHFPTFLIKFWNKVSKELGPAQKESAALELDIPKMDLMNMTYPIRPDKSLPNPLIEKKLSKFLGQVKSNFYKMWNEVKVSGREFNL